VEEEEEDMHFRLKPKIVALILYEYIFLCLWLAAIIPKGISFLEFWRNPFGFMVINEFSLALTLALFLPLVFKDVTKLKIFGAEIEVRREFEKVRSEIDQVKKEVAEQRYDYDRALFSIISGMNRQLHVKTRRDNQNLNQVPLEIGALDFAESWIIQQIVFRKLSREGVPVSDPETGETTLMTFFKLISGKIDFFVWYSGTGMAMAGMDIVPHAEEEGLAILNAYYRTLGLCWLPSLGFQSTEGLVMLKTKADERNIKTMSDLAAQANLLRFGANREYFLRHWAYPRLKRLGMYFNSTQEVSINDRLSGLLNGDFDVGIEYSTDPESNDKRIVLIECDDRFPVIPQYAMPLCREEISDVVRAAIKDLRIDEVKMRRMLSQTRKNNFSRLSIKGVAEDFIQGMKNAKVS
jgi:glycine betaine/choline ABC-type transport system substrate-binding protein